MREVGDTTLEVNIVEVGRAIVGMGVLEVHPGILSVKFARRNIQRDIRSQTKPSQEEITSKI